MKKEIEVKVRVGDAEEISRRIEAAGGSLVVPRTFEDNRLYDLPDGALGRAGGLLRLREAGGRAVLTGKGPAGAAAGARYKVRTEEESVVPSAEAMASVLAAAGFIVRWRYQKYRREYRMDGALVTVDETPHGPWIEIEGEPAAIEAAAARLGVDGADFETLTYRELHERECARAGRPVGDMVFVPGPGGFAS